MWNIKKLKNSEGKIYLNIGSSSDVLENFVNIDNATQLQLIYFHPLIKLFLNKKQNEKFESYRRAKKKAFLKKHNCIKALPVPNSSVDHILCSHILEHVYHQELLRILNDYYRILSQKGTLHIILPNLRSRINRYVNENDPHFSADEFMRSLQVTSKERPNIKTRFREFIVSYGHLHRWMYDLDSITSILISIGFKLIKDIESPSSFWRLEDKDEINIHVIKE